MDIATLLESHRRYFNELVGELMADEPPTGTDLIWAHDRATIRVWGDVHREPQNGYQPVGQAAPAQPAVASRKVRAGSKAARQRALKAGETRRKNLADKAKAVAQGALNSGTFTVTTGHTTGTSNVSTIPGSAGEGGAA